MKATESAGKTRNRLLLTPRLQWIVLEETRTFMVLLSVDHVVDLSCTENILEGFWNGIYTGPKSAPEIKQSTQIKARQQNTGNSLAKDKRSFARLQGKGYWY